MVRLYGKVTKGVYPFMEHLKTAISAYDGREIVIEIKERTKRRSVNQERFYRGVILPMIRDFENHRKDAAFSLDSIHLWCKLIMGRTRYEKMPDGEYREVPISNADLKTMDYEKGNDILRAYYAKEGLQIPYPHEVMNGNY